MVATRRSQAASSSPEKPHPVPARSSKRKRKPPSGSEGDESDHEERDKKTKVDNQEQEKDVSRLKPVEDENQTDVTEATAVVDNEIAKEDPIVCSCPKNIVRCIGILPSLPIAYEFCDDSDESDSSSDDTTPHVLLPRAERQKKGCED